MNPERSTGDSPRPRIRAPFGASDRDLGGTPGGSLGERLQGFLRAQDDEAVLLDPGQQRTMQEARRTADVDDELLAGYRTLVGLRRSSAALARGGIRFAHVGPDAIAYLRETTRERLLCLATRAPTVDVRLPLAALRADALEPLYGAEARSDGGTAVLPGDGPAFHVWKLG